MSVIIPVRNDGIEPVDFLSPYFGSLTDREIAILVGSVVLLKDVKYKLLGSLLDLKKIEVEEKLGRIMQTDFWEGEFGKYSFKLTKLNYNLMQQHPELELHEKSMLAYLKARYVVSIDELQKSFSLNYESAIHYLALFITKGLISTEHNEQNDTFNIVVYYKLPRKEPDEVTDLEKKIVGYVRLKEVTMVKNISSDLEIPEHIVQESIMEMILSDLILCAFDISYNKFRSFEVHIKIKNFLIAFQNRPLSMMNPSEKFIIGLSNLMKGVRLKELRDYLKISNSELLGIISKLNGTREFEFRLNEKNQLISVTVPVFDVNSNIDEIDRNSAVNYRSMLGLVKAKQSIQLSEIADRMKISISQVIKGLIDLYLNGFIMGSIYNLKTFKLENVRTISHEYVTFEDWEKVILGGLLSEGKLSMVKLGSLLGLNKAQTQEKALAFMSLNVGELIITNAYISLKKTIKIPPLSQIHDLDLTDQQLFCFLVTNNVVNLRKLRNIFSLKNQEIYRRIYLIVGSGLLQVESSKQLITVKKYFKNTPIDPIETLDHDLRKLIQLLEREKNDKIRLSSIATKLMWSVDEVNLDISYLVGMGYYKGHIKGRHFYKASGLFKFKDKPKCFDCNTTLDNFREPCPNCFARPPQCSVCRSKMNSSENIVVCPHCNNAAHYVHIKSWLKIKGFCPICRNALRLGVMKPLIE